MAEEPLKENLVLDLSNIQSLLDQTERRATASEERVRKVNLSVAAASKEVGLLEVISAKAAKRARKHITKFVAASLVGEIAGELGIPDTPVTRVVSVTAQTFVTQGPYAAAVIALLATVREIIASYKANEQKIAEMSKKLQEARSAIHDIREQNKVDANKLRREFDEKLRAAEEQVEKNNEDLMYETWMARPEAP